MNKSDFTVVGQPLPKIDAWGKVTGETRYADDLVLPRMAYGKLLRSSHAHARIVRVDTSRARALSVITTTALSDLQSGAIFSTSGTNVRSTKSTLSSAWLTM